MYIKKEIFSKIKKSTGCIWKNLLFKAKTGREHKDINYSGLQLLACSDETFRSLRWYSSVVHVHQNELLHWTSSVVQCFPKNENKWLNHWTRLNLKLVELTCVQATKYESNKKLPYLFTRLRSRRVVMCLVVVYVRSFVRSFPHKITSI